MPAELVGEVGYNVQLAVEIDVDQALGRAAQTGETGDVGEAGLAVIAEQLDAAVV